MHIKTSIKAAAYKCLALSLALVMSFHDAQAHPVREADTHLTLSRDGNRWIAEFRFSRASPVWYFRRTRNSVRGVEWRSASFRIETPGVSLARIGHYDTLFRADGAPIGQVRISFEPYSEPLALDYTPVLTFSDGGLAFYTGHFAIVPETTLTRVAVLGREPETTLPTENLLFQDPGHRIMFNGHVTDSPVGTGIHDDGTYIYTGINTGKAVAEETASFSRVIDPGLPAWVRSDLDTFLPRLMDLYTARLGALTGRKPAALIAWGGAARGGYSQSGSVMPGLIAISLSGKDMENPNPKVQDLLRWFFGHETSHFWLGQTVMYQKRKDQWITEGGADFLSIQAITSIDPAFGGQARWQQEMDDCLAMAGAGKSLAQAEERGDGKAQYTCGALLDLAASTATRGRQPGSDGFTFIRHLIDNNRDTGRVTEDTWLEAFATVADARTVAQVKAFIDAGSADPVAFWQALFTATGVPFQRDGARIRMGSAATPAS
jgi:hypothetical protein